MFEHGHAQSRRQIALFPFSRYRANERREGETALDRYLQQRVPKRVFEGHACRVPGHHHRALAYWGGNRLTSLLVLTVHDRVRPWLRVLIASAIPVHGGHNGNRGDHHR
jgi:hypothetical protein